MDFYLNQDNSFDRLWNEYKKYNSLVVAYDFDNTVYDCHNKGWQFEKMIDLLRNLKKIGCHLIIFTANDDLNFVKNYCTEKQIPFDTINENPPFFQSNNRKIYYNALLDDRAGLRQVYTELTKLIKTIQHENL